MGLNQLVVREASPEEVMFEMKPVRNAKDEDTAFPAGPLPEPGASEHTREKEAKARSAGTAEVQHD